MKTYEKLCDILSQADDYVNGEKMAQELGLLGPLFGRPFKNLRKRRSIESSQESWLSIA